MRISQTKIFDIGGSNICMITIISPIELVFYFILTKYVLPLSV